MDQNEIINTNVNIQPVAPTYTYAGFWWRFLAYIIDGFIINFVLFIPYMIFSAIFSLVTISNRTVNDNESALLGIIFSIFIIILSFASIIGVIIYYSWFESSKYQATPGKKLLGIIVTDESGYKLTFKKALLRNICKLLSGIILDIGFIMAAFTEKNQALHDIMAKTLVLKKV